MLDQEENLDRLDQRYVSPYVYDCGLDCFQVSRGSSLFELFFLKMYLFLSPFRETPEDLASAILGQEDHR